VVVLRGYDKDIDIVAELGLVHGSDLYNVCQLFDDYYLAFPNSPSGHQWEFCMDAELPVGHMMRQFSREHGCLPRHLQAPDQFAYHPGLPSSWMSS